MSFVGSYTHSLDAKKRVFIPAKFREELGDVFYVTLKCDGYLSIYTEDDWSVYLDKIQKLPESIAYDVQNAIIGSAQKCVPDASGRIILEDNLMKHAKITKNVVFVGVGKQIRVWSEEVWAECEKKRDFEKIREILREYGL